MIRKEHAKEVAELRARLAVLERERDKWYRICDEAWTAVDDTTLAEPDESLPKAIRRLRARLAVIEAREEAGIDNGNAFVFCDYVDEKRRGCVRGAGHNGLHAVCLPPYPQEPVLLAPSSPADTET